MTGRRSSLNLNLVKSACPLRESRSIGVDDNRENNHTSGDHLSHKISNAHQDQAVGENADKTGPEKCADERSATAIEASAANDDGSDCVQLEPAPQDWAGDGEPCHVDDRADSDRQTGNDKHGDFIEEGIVAGKTDRFFIVADGIKEATKDGPGQYDPTGCNQSQSNHEYSGCPEPTGGPKGIKLVRKLKQRTRICHLESCSTSYVQHAERHDEGRNAPKAHDESVHEAAYHANNDAG